MRHRTSGFASTPSSPDRSPTRIFPRPTTRGGGVSGGPTGLLRWIVLPALTILLTLFLPIPSDAHDLGQSYVFLRVYDHEIEARVEIAAPDVYRILGLQPEARITRAEIERHLNQLLEYVRPRLTIRHEGEPLELTFVGSDKRWVDKADFVLLRFMIDELEPLPEALDVEFTVMLDEHALQRNMLIIEHNWRTSTFNNESNVSLIFSGSDRRQTLNLTSASVFQGFMGFVRLGIWHIWVGLDHILFLIALVLPSVLYRRETLWRPVGSFRPALLNIAAIVTFFTIGHSLTLSLATLDVVNLPSRFVESVIAASIAVAALHNIYPRFVGKEWTLALIFGLFHGFGFAGVLKDIGLESTYLVLSLLGFNLGVEAGQIAIIAAVFPVLFLLRTAAWYPRTVLRFGSMALVAVALFWFTERAFDLPLYQYASNVPGYVYRHIFGGA